MSKADVFADIVNGGVFILTGRWPSPLVRAEDLVDASTRSLSTTDDKVRGQVGAFRSDFRIVADYVRQTCQNKDFAPSDQMIVHVEAVARFLSALTGDRGLVENLPNIQKRGVPMTVRDFFDEARQEGFQLGKAQGIQIGEARGEARGGLNMLISLVGDGSLPLAVAAKKAGMSEDEFKTRMCGQEGVGKS